MLRIALDRDHVDRLRLMGMHRNRKTEVARQIPADLVPVFAASSLRITSQCFCMNSTFGRAGVHGDIMDAVSDLRVGVGELVVGLQPVVDRPPSLHRRHPSGRRPPPRWRYTSSGDLSGRSGWCANTSRPRPGAQAPPSRCAGRRSSCQVPPPSLERNRAASSTPRVDRVWVALRGFQVPDPLELPGALCAVIKLVGAGVTFVGELVASRRPGFPAVIRALYHLPKPTAGLGGVQPVWVGGGSLQMVHLPTRK